MNENSGTTEAPQEPRPEGPYADHDGPRVSADEVRDLGRLRRSTSDKYLAGVSGGLGRHLDVDPILLRVAFVVLTFFGGVGLLVYLACWVLVPEEGSERAVVHLDQRSRTVALVVVGGLSGLLLLGDVWGSDAWGWFPWPFLVVGLLVLLAVTRGERRRSPERPAGLAPYRTEDTGVSPSGSGAPAPGGPPPARVRDPRKRGPLLFWFTMALAALALGVLGIADLAGLAVGDSAYPALALGVVAAMLLVGAFWGRAGGLILVGLLLIPVLAGSAVAERWDGTTIDETPTSAADLDSDYDVAAGQVKLDLTEIRDLGELDGRTIEIDVLAGQVDLLVPEDLTVTANGNVNAGGTIEIFGAERDGWDVHLRGRHDGGRRAPELHIDADVTMGQLKVRTQ